MAAARAGLAPRRWDVKAWAGCAAMAGAAVAARRLWARRMRHVTAGQAPGVRTDDGLLLHTEIDGRADARVTVVFAHGFAARLEEYDAQREALRDRARLVLFDQRGHGRSGWGSPRMATIERLGRDLGCVLDAAADGRPVVLVGHSMGGMAVLALARRRPDLFAGRVACVALVSTSAGHMAQIELPRGVARIVLRTGVASGCLWLVWALAPLIDLVGPFRTRPGRRWLRRRLFGRVPPPDDVVSKMQEMWTSTPQSLAAAFYPAIASYDEAAALGVLRSIPTLVLTGTEDATIPLRHSERIAHEIGPTARLVRVPGAGHMVNMTHPGAVNTALLQLLEQAERVSEPRRVAS